MFPDAGIKLERSQKLYTNYADDIKLITKSPSELSAIYSELRRCLAALGLVCEGSKCKLLLVNGGEATACEHILDGATPTIVSELRFLGLRIDSEGGIGRWKTDY